jgi:hypothetical protein
MGPQTTFSGPRTQSEALARGYPRPTLTTYGLTTTMRSVVSSSITFPQLISITSNRAPPPTTFLFCYSAYSPCKIRHLYSDRPTHKRCSRFASVTITLPAILSLKCAATTIASPPWGRSRTTTFKFSPSFYSIPCLTTFAHLQQVVLNMTLLPDFNSEMGRQVYLGRRRADPLPPRTTRAASSNPTAHQALSHSNQSAFAALNSRQRGPKPIYSNCKRENHSTDYCISPGGKMAGRSVAEARAAFKAAAALQY